MYVYLQHQSLLNSFEQESRRQHLIDLRISPIPCAITQANSRCRSFNEGYKP